MSGVFEDVRSQGISPGEDTLASIPQFYCTTITMGSIADLSINGGNGKKQLLLNAFDMSTIGHLSPGQWKVCRFVMDRALLTYVQNPKDKSTTKRSLDYWINLAQLLERGGINALFLADTYGGYDTYENSLDDCIRRAAQWPMTDPSIVSFGEQARLVHD